MQATTKLIIDTDVMIDDWMAILYLLSCPNVEVIGISVSGTGGSYLSYGSRNVLALLKIFNLDYKVPVAAGYQSPMVYSNVFPYKYRDKSNRFNGISIPPSDAPLSDKPIPKFYDDLIDAEQDSVRVLSIGGATNLGRWLEIADLKRVSKISDMVIMGGAVTVPGNLSDLTDDYKFNQVAEWNVFVDVKGMDNIFKSSPNKYLIALDGINKAMLSKDFAEEFKSKTKGVAAGYVGKMLDVYFTGVSLLPLFDPVAACVMANIDSPDLSSLATFNEMPLSVEQRMVVSGERDLCGNTSRDDKGNPVKVCVNVSAKKLEQLFIEVFE